MLNKILTLGLRSTQAYINVVIMEDAPKSSKLIMQVKLTPNLNIFLKSYLIFDYPDPEVATTSNQQSATTIKI